MYMYVCFKDSAAPAHARIQARGATPELRRITDTTPHGLSAAANVAVIAEEPPRLGRQELHEARGGARRAPTT